MIGFAGAVRLDGALLSADILHRWRDGLAEPGAVTLHHDHSALLACQARPGIPAAAGPHMLSDGTSLIADARLDDRLGLATTLGIAPVSDAGLAAAAWLRWGEDAIRHLFGDVALAHWDGARRTLTLARDALGGRALHVFDAGDTLFFASAFETLLALPGLPREIDALALLDQFTGGARDEGRTIFRAIRCVPSGSVMTFRPGGRETRRWWSLEGIAPVRLARDEDYVEAARALLDQAVASRLPATGRVATMLSGGFDSAAVTATAARRLGDRRLLAYTRVAGAAHPYGGMDERGHAASVAALYPNIDWSVIDAPPDAAVPLEWEAAARGHLQLASFNCGWFDTVHAAAEAAGAGVLLIGNAGNSAFSGSGVFRFVELAGAGRWGQAFGLARRLARQEQLPLRTVLRNHLLPLLEPRGLRRWRLMRRHDGASPWLEHALLSPDLLAATGFDERARRAGTDLPYMPRSTGREMRHRLLTRQGTGEADDYFRRKRRFARLDPYRDRRLIEFTLGLPEEQFIRDGVRRSLARQALADRLPETLLAENRRGRQSPEWHRILSLHRERLAAVVDELGGSPLAGHVFDVPRIRSLFEALPADAEVARREERRFGSALYRAILVGDFLRRWEAGER